VTYLRRDLSRRRQRRKIEQELPQIPCLTCKRSYASLLELVHRDASAWLRREQCLQVKSVDVLCSADCAGLHSQGLARTEHIKTLYEASQLVCPYWCDSIAYYARVRMIGSVPTHAPHCARSTKPSHSHRCVTAFAKKKAGKKGSKQRSKVSASGYALTPVIPLQLRAIAMHRVDAPYLRFCCWACPLTIMSGRCIFCGDS
jgi:hypothetical protein